MCRLPATRVKGEEASERGSYSTRVRRLALLLAPVTCLTLLLPAAAREAPREVAALRAQLGETPGDAAGWRRLGDLERSRCRLAASREAYRRALDRDPFDVAARAGVAETWRLAGDLDRALRAAWLGLLAPGGREHADLWRIRAMVCLADGDLAAGLDAARRATALAPFDARAAEALARAWYHRGDAEGARQTYELAIRLDPASEEANLRLGSGLGRPQPDAPWRRGGPRAAWETAQRLWSDGRYDAAAEAVTSLLADDPWCFKYRLLLGLAQAGARRRAEAGYEAAADLYLRLPTPVARGIESFVPGYERLGAVEAHVVRAALAPARSFVAPLAQAGARHEILSLDRCLDEAEERRDLADRVTVDGRRYRQLRGVGGRHAATGIEKLREAAELGFNVYAHEFAHQLHRFALPPARVTEVSALYRAAERRGRFLDWYAASNEDEYFAQGYEAFVSHAKRGCLKETQHHTRADLARVDPALHAFFLEILDLEHEAGDALDAFRAGLPR